MFKKNDESNCFEIVCHNVGLRLVTTIVVVMLIGLVSATSWAAQKEKVKISDQQITNAVDERLFTDSALMNSQIDARTNEGIVTLSGTANHLIAKERAAMLTQTIRGVRGVVNNIFLRIPSLPDDEVRTNVESALFYDAATDSYNLKTSVKDGIVTLSGTVQSYGEKELAGFVVKGVNGVKEVKNSITVATRSKRPDVEIAAEVQNIIAIDAWLNPSLIKIKVKDGVVTLIGEVGSSAQYDRAKMLAWTDGVKSVNTSGLLIEPWATSTERNETNTIRGDSQIKQAVHDMFVNDPRVLSFNLVVEVKMGIVTLTGVVDNLKAKRSAEQDAKNTVGVRRVKNLLRVRSTKSLGDDKITQNLKSALLRSPVVDSYAIAVKSIHGIVTLSGTVDSFLEKVEAEDVASRARGVIKVKNNLAVSYPSDAYYYYDGYDPYLDFPSYDLNVSQLCSSWSYTSDAEVKEKIKEKMFWSPWVNLEDITVKVSNGVATLTGKTNSWFMFNKATENAYEGGARQVINNITVR